VSADTALLYHVTQARSVVALTTPGSESRQGRKICTAFYLLDGAVQEPGPAVFLAVFVAVPVAVFVAVPVAVPGAVPVAAVGQARRARQPFDRSKRYTIKRAPQISAVEQYSTYRRVEYGTTFVSWEEACRRGGRRREGTHPHTHLPFKNKQKMHFKETCCLL
jgi:hypothetical protein